MTEPPRAPNPPKPFVPKNFSVMGDSVYERRAKGQEEKKSWRRHESERAQMPWPIPRVGPSVMNYPTSASHLQSVRVMGSVSHFRSEPCYGFGTEPLPEPGKKQAWRMGQPREGVVETSAGPIYKPNPFCMMSRPPIYSLGARKFMPHLGQMTEHPYLSGAKEFVVGGAVFPSAPPPVGNAPWGRSYAAGAINEVGRGSNKARIDAINAWLDLPTDFKVKVDLGPEPEPYKGCSLINELGRDTGKERKAVIEAFLARP